MAIYDDDKGGFERWMRAVDDLVLSKVGVGTDDLPDVAYYDMFEDGDTPSAAARRAIRYAWEG